MNKLILYIHGIVFYLYGHYGDGRDDVVRHKL